MWLFLGSECLLFGGLISTYLLYRGRVAGGPGAARTIYDIPFTSVSSFMLLMSSLTMVLAVSAIERGDMPRARIWLVATALLGAMLHRRPGLRVHGLLPRGPGLHDQPVRLALLHADRLPRRARDGRHHHVAVALHDDAAGHACTRSKAETVEIVGLYWHFVDIVWIVIFTVVYLIPA